MPSPVQLSNNPYWAEYWNQNEIVYQADKQQQVGRTINHVPIKEEVWHFTLQELERILAIKPHDTVLDLAAGNGLIAMPLARKCRGVTAVDFSAALGLAIDRSEFPNIDVIIEDIRLLRFSPDSYSKVLLYFALQFFTETEVCRLFASIHEWLVPGGVALIGDIPDADRMWDFFNNRERENAYFDSLRNEIPILGSWFKRDFLAKLGRYAKFSEVSVLDQNPRLINSHYRFDLRLVK